MVSHFDENGDSNANYPKSPQWDFVTKADKEILLKEGWMMLNEDIIEPDNENVHILVYSIDSDGMKASRKRQMDRMRDWVNSGGGAKYEMDNIDGKLGENNFRSLPFIKWREVPKSEAYWPTDEELKEISF